MMYAYQKPLEGRSVGVVFGSFAPLHQGHLDLIMRAKKENDGGALVIVCGYDGDKGEPLMPHKKRYRYVREFFADDDLVAVYSINDSEIGIGQLLMVRRYREQWIWWAVIDLLCIKMWFVAGNWSMVAMYVGWTANCIYGWYNWTKLNRTQSPVEER